MIVHVTQNKWAFGPCSLSSILKSSIPETGGFQPQARARHILYLVLNLTGNLLRLALSKRTNRVGLSLLTSEWKEIHFLKCDLYCQNTRKWAKLKETGILRGYYLTET
jgi:hypothetical protein